MLGPRDVGHRVVVRHNLDLRHPQPDRPRFTDVLGELRAFGPDRLVVRRADGVEVVVPLASVVAAKRVPPRRPTRREILALERVAAAAWPAPETAWLGDWLLRAGEGWTGRANSVLPLGAPDRDLSAALDEVARWYAERDLPARFDMPLPPAADLDRTLAARGWPLEVRTLVLTAALPALREALTPRPDLSEVRFADAPDDAWLALAAARKGGLPRSAMRILTGGARPTFASVRDGEQLIATARGSLDEGWLGVFLVEVVPDHRRRGLARHVMHALAGWAARHGATRCFLQVEERNAAALELYRGLGFRTHHEYVRRAATTGPGSCGSGDA